MAETIGNMVFGLGNYVLSIGDYVAAKGAGTLVDVGILENGSEIDVSEESTDIFSDKHLGPLSQEPHKRTCTLKFMFKETILDNLAIALGADSADVTGTAPNETLKLNVDEKARYHQVSVVVPGIGTTGTRTITFWRCRRTGPVKLAYKKDNVQMVELTLAVLEEIGGAGDPEFFQIVDT